MPSFNDLPYELREQIIIDALYCTYTNHEIDAALENESQLSAGLARASIKLGQRTLKALKLTNRRMYIEAAKASRIWLDYETIDLLEELESITARLFKHSIDSGSRVKFYSTVVSGVDLHRCLWISKMEIRTVCLYKRRLDEVELRTWKRLRSTFTGTESIEGFCEFMNMMERQDASQGDCGNTSPHSQRRCGLSRRQELLTLSFYGVDVGPDAIYAPGTDRYDSVLARWKRQRTLPEFRYGVSIMQWFRPCQKRKILETLKQGHVQWETRLIREHGTTSEEYKQFLKLSNSQKSRMLIYLSVPGVPKGMFSSQ